MAGISRQKLARLVEEKSQQLMRQDGTLSAKDAFLKATDLVLRDNPTLLSAYRADVEEI